MAGSPTLEFKKRNKIFTPILFFQTDQEVASHAANDDGNYDIDSLYDFLAARGRRANDHFWANRGKRAMSHDIQIRDGLSNHPKPNGFIFLMGKRSLLEPGDLRKQAQLQTWTHSYGDIWKKWVLYPFL